MDRTTQDRAEHTFRPEQCLTTIDMPTSAFVCNLPKGHDRNHHGELVVFGERNVWLDGAQPVRPSDWVERLQGRLQ